MTRGFLVTAYYLCRGLHSPGTACSTTSPPAVRYTVFPVSKEEKVRQSFASSMDPVCFICQNILKGFYVASSRVVVGGS